MRRPHIYLAVLLVLMKIVACKPTMETKRDSKSVQIETDPASSDTVVANEPDLPVYEVELCGSCEYQVTSLNDLVAVINDFPKPLQLETLVSALMKDAAIIGSTNSFSAQAPKGEDPRILVRNGGGLIFSILPGSNSLELSEETLRDFSKKAHLDFPIEDDISEKNLFFKVSSGEDGDMNTCGTSCHRPRLSADGQAFPYESNKIAVSNRYKVSVQQIADLHASCESKSKTCAMYDAIFIHGNPQFFNFISD